MFSCCMGQSEEDVALQEEYDKLKHRPSVADAKSPQPLIVVQQQQDDEGGNDFSPEANQRKLELQKEYGQQLHQECKSPRVDMANLRRIVSTCPSSVQYQNRNQEYALHVLCKNKKSKLDMIQYVAEEFPLAARHGSSSDGSLPLHYACEAKLSFSIIQYVMSIYETANNIPNELGMWPIHIACFHECNSKTIKHMLKIHPELIDKRTKSGMLAIHLAASFPKKSVFEAFVEQKSGLLQELDPEGNTSLHIACANNASYDCIAYLCHGYLPSLTMANHKHDLPLHLVVSEPKVNKKNKLKVVTFLVQNHWNATMTTNRNGNLPIHIAIGNKASFKLIEYLAGVAPESLKTQTTKDGLTPLHVACQIKSNQKIISYLMMQWKDALLVPTYGSEQLPIHIAALKRSSIAVIQCLARQSPESLQKKDANGKTPAEIAVESVAEYYGDDDDGDGDATSKQKKKTEVDQMVKWLQGVSSGSLPLQPSIRQSLRQSITQLSFR